jgi:hypothetical protein
MKNIRTFDQFVNEGLFSSKFRNLVDKLYKYILTADLNTISGDSYNGYTFRINKNNKINKEQDPYGEENWGDDVAVELNWHSSNSDFLSGIGVHIYELIINGDKANVANMEARKLFKAVERRFKYRDRDEKILKNKEIEDRLNQIADKL